MSKPHPLPQNFPRKKTTRLSSVSESRSNGSFLHVFIGKQAKIKRFREMAARLVVVVNVVLSFLALVVPLKQIAATSVSPETNTKPKKKDNMWKRRKTPGITPGKRSLELYSHNKQRTLIDAIATDYIIEDDNQAGNAASNKNYWEIFFFFLTSILTKSSIMFISSCLIPWAFKCFLSSLKEVSNSARFFHERTLWM